MESAVAAVGLAPQDPQALRSPETLAPLGAGRRGDMSLQTQMDRAQQLQTAGQADSAALL